MTSVCSFILGANISIEGTEMPAIRSIGESALVENAWKHNHTIYGNRHELWTKPHSNTIWD